MCLAICAGVGDVGAVELPQSTRAMRLEMMKVTLQRGLSMLRVYKKARHCAR